MFFNTLRIQTYRSEARFLVQSSGHLLIFQDIQERFTVCKSKWFGCWNEICSSRIRPINISRICSQLSQIRGNFHLPLSDYDYVSNGEFLKNLVFSDRTEKSNLVLVFQSWKMTMDRYSYLITLQVF